METEAEQEQEPLTPAAVTGGAGVTASPRAGASSCRVHQAPRLEQRRAACARTAFGSRGVPLGHGGLGRSQHWGPARRGGSEGDEESHDRARVWTGQAGRQRAGLMVRGKRDHPHEEPGPGRPERGSGLGVGVWDTGFQRQRQLSADGVWVCHGGQVTLVRVTGATGATEVKGREAGC